MRVVNRDVNPLLTSLPGWVDEYRPHQIDAVIDVIAAFDEVPVVVLDAPTGSGKTLIAETVRRIMELPAVYVCTSKSLQQQFLRDYPYAKLLMGRANYATREQPVDFHPWEPIGHVSCEDCTWSIAKSCELCGEKTRCPYENAKQDAVNSDLAVLNTAYFLAEANHAGRFSKQELIVADEADVLERTLMDYVSVQVTPGRMRRYGWKPPDKVTVEETWRHWVTGMVDQVRGAQKRIPKATGDRTKQRERRRLGELAEKLAAIRDGGDEWLYTGRRGDEGASFKPARVDRIAPEMLWKHGKRWLLMSATVISAEEMLGSLGYTGEYRVVRCPSTFPKENRPVRYRPVASMSRKAKETSWPTMVAAVRGLVDNHMDERVLIHTVSYELSAMIVDGLQHMGRKIVSYRNSAERDNAIAEYKTTDAAVLVASSLDRGIDLPGELCRVQILTKVPYGNLGDKQVSARLYGQGGRTWYSVTTIRTLVQMTGRGIRSAEDYAVTYVCDTDFQKLWNQGRGMFPTWFSEAIEWR